MNALIWKGRVHHASANFSLKSQVLDDTAPVIARLTRTSCTASCTCRDLDMRVLYVPRAIASCIACIHTYITAARRGAARRGGRLSCTARLSSSKADVVSTRREYSRTTHRINKIYPWTTRVRLSYFKNLPPHSARLSSLLLGPCGRVDGNFSVAPHRL